MVLYLLRLVVDQRPVRLDMAELQLRDCYAQLRSANVDLADKVLMFLQFLSFPSRVMFKGHM